MILIIFRRNTGVGNISWASHAMRALKSSIIDGCCRTARFKFEFGLKGLFPPGLAAVGVVGLRVVRRCCVPEPCCGRPSVWLCWATRATTMSRAHQCERTRHKTQDTRVCWSAGLVLVWSCLAGGAPFRHERRPGGSQGAETRAGPRDNAEVLNRVPPSRTYRTVVWLFTLISFKKRFLKSVDFSIRVLFWGMKSSRGLFCC